MMRHAHMEKNIMKKAVKLTVPKKQETWHGTPCRTTWGRTKGGQEAEGTERKNMDMNFYCDFLGKGKGG